MRVLVAEDSVVMRRLLVRTLEGWGYEVAEAENGKDAWEQFLDNPFQLVVTDWVMPEMDGLELIRQIVSSKYNRYVYIILLTAMSEKDDLVAGMEAGADDFLVKPVDHNELRVRLRAGERIIQLEHNLEEKNLQLVETQTALLQSEKLASLGQMAAGMAHEINNPIALVANNLAVLKRDVADAFEILDLCRNALENGLLDTSDVKAKIAELTEKCDYAWIREQSPQLFDKSLIGLERVRKVVHNLRQFARLDEAELDELAIEDLLGSVSEVLQHEFEFRQVELRIENNPVPPIVCEPVKIQQVLHSLLMNALQASEPGSEVVLRTSRSEVGIVIEIEDQGYGIASEDLAHIFEPFFTSQPVGSGQGLGLSLSYGIVRDHGGTIEVTSSPGEGSTFRVQLPLRPSKV